MKIVETVQVVRAIVRDARTAGRRIGLVPTMGALHAGHLSLVEASRKAGNFVVVSIFVNPTQFGPNEDLAAYPKDAEGDIAKCRAAGVDLVFMPGVEEVYPTDCATRVCVDRLTEHLCGAHRPGHFDGVTLVVAKLFNMIQPDAAYFGQKDAQQLAVIRRMTMDLNMPIEIVGCPIVREDDGVAMSSRNAYLTPEQRVQARSLYAGLSTAAADAAAGERDVTTLTGRIRGTIESAGPCEIDYASVVDPATIQPVERVSGPALMAVAVRIGRARLIDNMLVEPASGE